MSSFGRCNRTIRHTSHNRLNFANRKSRYHHHDVRAEWLRVEYLLSNRAVEMQILSCNEMGGPKLNPSCVMKMRSGF